jgi:nucleoside-diphosphate-sugar epimerase
MRASNLIEPILITGATGFIGRWLVRRLLAERCFVRAFVLPGETVPDEWAVPVEVVRGDVTDAASVARAVNEARTIFHLAAIVGDAGNEAQHQQVTVGGTGNVLRAADPRARIVLTSSLVVYGDRLGLDVCAEDHAFGRALGRYSRAKQAQERLAWQLAEARGLPLTVVRPANVFGPGVCPWVTGIITQMNTRLPALIDDGDYNAGLTYVENLVDLLILAAEHPAAVGRVYNGCDGWEVTWKQYVTDIARLAGTPPPWSLPRRAAFAVAEACEALWYGLLLPGRPPVSHEAVNLAGAHHRLPADRARTELGHSPRVSYAEAMQHIAAYLSQSTPRAPG